MASLRFFSVDSDSFCNSERLLLLEDNENQSVQSQERTMSDSFDGWPSRIENKRKEINQMNRITNYLSVRPRNLSSLALLFATLTLLAFAPHSARAGNEIPFHANFITQVTTFLEFPILHVTVNGKGKATHMGTTTAFTDDQIQNVVDRSGSATYTLTAARGDTLTLALVVPVGGTINIEGGVIFSGTYTVTGGTGRFNGATGSGVFGGSGLFLTETDGIGAFALVGTISLPGN